MSATYNCLSNSNGGFLYDLQYSRVAGKFFSFVPSVGHTVEAILGVARTGGIGGPGINNTFTVTK